MTTRTIGLLVLVLAPAGLAYFAGFNEAAHYVGLGSVLALYLGVLARPLRMFSLLVPVVYAAAAITAQSTDGVVARVVAIAAAVGAASSQGLHRGLIALLAAALIGSFEPALGTDVMRRAGLLLAGSTYGLVLVVTALRNEDCAAPRVPAQSALGYTVLLAFLVLFAWFAARLATLPHPWWLPLAVVAVSEPVPRVSPGRALRGAVLALAATALLVLTTDAFDVPLARIALLGLLAFAALRATARHYAWLALLGPPVLVLLSSHAEVHAPSVDYLLALLPAFLPVLGVTCLGHWLFWTLRPPRGRLAT